MATENENKLNFDFEKYKKQELKRMLVRRCVLMFLYGLLLILSVLGVVLIGLSINYTLIEFKDTPWLFYSACLIINWILLSIIKRLVARLEAQWNMKS